MMKDDVIGHLNPNGTFLMTNNSLSRLEPDSVAVRGGIGSKFKAKHYPHAGRENPDRLYLLSNATYFVYLLLNLYLFDVLMFLVISF